MVHGKKLGISGTYHKFAIIIYEIHLTHFVINIQDKWIGLLHHVCNQHEWIGGKCEHDDGDHDET